MYPHPSEGAVLMRLILPLTLLPALLTAPCARAQNTGAQATPQTNNARPAGTANGNGGSQRGRAPQRFGAGRNGAARSGGQRQPPAPAANSSVGVIGAGKLGPGATGMGSAALPGVAILHNAYGIAPGTPISVRLQQQVDSGHAKNGDTVRAVLTSPVGSLPSGAPVLLTVVAAAAAGEISSSGTLSLQVISINGQDVLSQVITAEGKEGVKTLADDAPARGTEAVFTPAQPITLPAA